MNQKNIRVMTHLIDKDALVAWAKETYLCENASMVRKVCYKQLLEHLNTLEVKEVGISIPNIDDTLKEEGLDPDSKEAKVFKESYYLALEKLKAQKGE